MRVASCLPWACCQFLQMNSCVPIPLVGWFLKMEQKLSFKEINGMLGIGVSNETVPYELPLTGTSPVSCLLKWHSEC